MTRRIARSFIFLVCLGCIATVGCADSPTPDEPTVAAPSEDADRRTIIEIRDAYVAASRAGEVNALLALYVDDPVVMPPGRPAIEGLRALRDHEQAHHDAFAHPALEYESQELVVAGDWAFDRGIERLTEAPKDGSASIDVVGKYLTVYQRQPGGGWKIARGIFNSSEDGVGGGSPFLLAQPCM